MDLTLEEKLAIINTAYDSIPPAEYFDRHPIIVEAHRRAGIVQDLSRKTFNRMSKKAQQEYLDSFESRGIQCVFHS